MAFTYTPGEMVGHFVIAPRENRWEAVIVPGFAVEHDGIALFVHRVAMPKAGVLYLLEKGWVVSDPTTGHTVAGSREGAASRAAAMKNAVALIERVGKQTYVERVMTTAAGIHEDIEKGRLNAEPSRYPTEIVDKLPQ